MYSFCWGLMLSIATFTLSSISALPIALSQAETNNLSQALQKRRMVFSHHAESHFSTTYETTKYKKHPSRLASITSVSTMTTATTTRPLPLRTEPSIKAAVPHDIGRAPLAAIEIQQLLSFARILVVTNDVIKAPATTRNQPMTATTATAVNNEIHYTHHLTSSWFTQFSTAYTTIYPKTRNIPNLDIMSATAAVVHNDNASQAPSSQRSDDHSGPKIALELYDSKNNAAAQEEQDGKTKSSEKKRSTLAVMT